MFADAYSRMRRRKRSGGRAARLGQAGGAPPLASDTAAPVCSLCARAFCYSGQVCAAYSRFYVHRSIADAFAERLAKAAETLPVGVGSDPATRLCPLVTAEHRNTVDTLVRTGIEEGATLLTGGAPVPDRPGFFYRPTVFTDVHDDMRIARQEIFGLAASLWTRDVARAHRLAHAIRSGTVFINMPHALDATSGHPSTEPARRRDGQPYMSGPAHRRGRVQAVPAGQGAVARVLGGRCGPLARVLPTLNGRVRSLGQR
ncbi:aldehyde dehydrogenase family protein [Streptomyces sp. NPDC007162]|uniref:aldehyde dehydrogenase family protein n=1 Tax=Streptomyces sp. NPDC007162 TaxID=3156917 RepID=UPI0033E630C1